MHWNDQTAIAIDNSLPDNYDIRPLLHVHPIPISVIQGDHDYVDPGASQWKTLGRDHPGIEVTVIDRAGHNSWIDDDTAFDRALASALKYAGRGPGSAVSARQAVGPTWKVGALATKFIGRAWPARRQWG